MNLIEQISGQLGVDSDKAEGATGAVLNFAKENLGGVDFQSIIAKIPGAEGMMDKAPSAEDEGDGGGGLLGSLGGMAQSLTGSLGGLAGLTAVFAKLGLGPDAISKVVETINSYVGENKVTELLGGFLGGGQE